METGVPFDGHSRFFLALGLDVLVSPERQTPATLLHPLSGLRPSPRERDRQREMNEQIAIDRIFPPDTPSIGTRVFSALSFDQPLQSSAIARKTRTSVADEEPREGCMVVQREFAVIPFDRIRRNAAKADNRAFDGGSRAN